MRGRVFTKGQRADVSEDLAAFLDYIDGKLSGNPFVQMVDQAIRDIKMQEQERVNYMTWKIKMDEIRKEGIKEGIKEGMEKGMLSKAFTIALSMLKEKESIDKIARYTELSEAEIRKLQLANGLG